MIGTYFIFGIIGLTVSVSAAQSRFERELDAYCVATDGTRRDVAASQDGATNSYTRYLGEECVIARSVHSRRTVSRWHAQLDAADFDTLAGTEMKAPYCANFVNRAVARCQAFEAHSFTWMTLKASQGRVEDGKVEKAEP